MKTFGLSIVLMLVFPAVMSSSHAQEPDDDAIDRGRLVFRNNCLMCHTAELVESQRLTPAQWDAEVTKMVGWGAPVAAEETADLLGFLKAEFGPDRPRQTVNFVTVAPFAQVLLDAERLGVIRSTSLVAEADAIRERGRLAFATHCASCHDASATGGSSGTNLVDRPVLLQPERFREVVTQGRNKMPGFASVLNRQNEDDLREWLASLPIPAK